MGGSESKVDEEKVDENENKVVNQISPAAFTSIDVHGNSVLSSIVILLVILSLVFLGYLLLKRYGCCKTYSRSNFPPRAEGHRRQESLYGALWSQNRGNFGHDLPFGSMTIDGYDRGIGYRNVEANRLPYAPNHVLPIAAPPPILPLTYANSNISTASQPPPIIIQTSPHHQNRERENFPHEEFSPRKEVRREAYERLQGEIDKIKGDY